MFCIWLFSVLIACCVDLRWLACLFVLLVMLAWCLMVVFAGLSFVELFDLIVN